MIPEKIEREIVIAAPVERVWAVITEAEHIAGWFGDAGAELDELRPGGKMIMTWKEYGRAPAVIEKVDPPHFFSWRWTSGGPEPTADNSTLVEFGLSPEGDGTRLRVVESGFRDLPVSEEDQASRVAGNTEGWFLELNELQAYAEQLTH
ncbi:SRPBCC family protein [Actinopolymorpha alba]|uniref:SRPBCC family protein n=1 Tax=Actinopolymorpha alba TaxID=533267 RepID=UPI00036A087C|nr:SRPBCC family protein [Actinopolymorpha alba]